jgi:tRNA(His) 5'-end guanylyltransferase
LRKILDVNGSSNENPTDSQALRVINTVCRNVTSKGNTRGTLAIACSDENINMPLMKRPRRKKV